MNRPHTLVPYLLCFLSLGAGCSGSGDKKDTNQADSSNYDATGLPPDGPVCQENCAGRVCGPGRCEGICGQCPLNQVCSLGACVDASSCVDTCDSLDCDCDQVCGNLCGSCSPGWRCTDGCFCQCMPQCSGKQCGDNTCGGTCGTCGEDQYCSQDGLCLLEPCVEACLQRECGDGGLEGCDCGECSEDEYCSESWLCEGECGDGKCNGQEHCEKCPEDCGECLGECGNGICEGNETGKQCPSDCGRAEHIACADDSDCLFPEACVPALGICRSQCSGDEDCPGSQQCVPENPEYSYYNSCTCVTGSDCPDGNVCCETDFEYWNLCSVGCF